MHTEGKPHDIALRIKMKTYKEGIFHKISYIIWNWMHCMMQCIEAEACEGLK
jgi:hypothetical protein